MDHDSEKRGHRKKEEMKVSSPRGLSSTVRHERGAGHSGADGDGGAAAIDARQRELGFCGVGGVAQELLFKAKEATWRARQGAEAWRRRTSMRQWSLAR